MPHKVTCYSGSRYGEEPQSFDYAGQHWVVEAVLARWRSPQGLHFRVHAGAEVFLLYYDLTGDNWLVRAGEGASSTSGNATNRRDTVRNTRSDE